jgi:hypothetical protein
MAKSSMPLEFVILLESSLAETPAGLKELAFCTGLLYAIGFAC